MNKQQIQDAYPLSYTQMGMLFHHQMEKSEAVYHDIVIQLVDLPFEMDKLQQVVDDLVSANEILRTTLELSRFKKPLQVVHASRETLITRLDFSYADQAVFKDAKLKWIETEKQRGFELESSSLFRVFAINRNEHSFELAFSFHHLLLDGYSLRHLTAELLRCYALALEELPYEVDRSPAKYRDFIAAEKRAITSEATQQYWQTMLASHVRADIESAVTNNTERSVNHIAAVVPVEKTISTKIEDLSIALKVPRKAILLAVHLRAVSILSGQSDVMTGLVVNGRTEQLGSESVLGLFLNTVPFRVNIANQTWSALIQEIATQEKAISPHRRYPLGLMKKEHEGAEFFQHIFNYTSFNESAHVKRADDDVRGFEKTNYPFTVQATYNKSISKPEIFLELDGSVYDSADLSRFVKVYQTIFELLTNNPDTDCTLAGHAEISYRLLSAFKPSDIITVFADTCTNHAQRVALTFQNKSVSYQQLDEASNRIANGLVAIGVEPGQLVGVCLQHSDDLIVALLAVLKAGAAYVPLDPNQALERQNDILDDAKPAAVIVQDRIVGWSDNINQYRILDLQSDNQK
ncbi:condensation domain-containing protein, partial [Thalassotalea sp. 1_MG-2023]|uniref:condensation domain-containing protein n=1 Tax=Thalassotalea sp. 1_MG-2023 TaxID=3062680 RepID=UPI0026E135EC